MQINSPHRSREKIHPNPEQLRSEKKNPRSNQLVISRLGSKQGRNTKRKIIPSHSHQKHFNLAQRTLADKKNISACKSTLDQQHSARLFDSTHKQQQNSPSQTTTSRWRKVNPSKISSTTSLQRQNALSPQPIELTLVQLHEPREPNLKLIPSQTTLRLLYRPLQHSQRKIILAAGLKEINTITLPTTTTASDRHQPTTRRTGKTSHLPKITIRQTRRNTKKMPTSRKLTQPSRTTSRGCQGRKRKRIFEQPAGWKNADRIKIHRRNRTTRIRSLLRKKPDQRTSRSLPHTSRTGPQSLRRTRL